MNRFRFPALLLASLLAFSVPASVLAADDSLAARVQALEDREAIRTLLLDYGRHLDNRDWDAFAALFAGEEGTWNGGMGIARGPQQIREMMISTIGSDNTGAGGSGLSNLHLLGNEFIDVQGDRATALSKWIFIMTAAEGGPDVVFVGHYADELVKQDGVWRFHERVVHGDIMRPTTVAELNPDTTTTTP
jgi:hypothetical protein